MKLHAGRELVRPFFSKSIQQCEFDKNIVLQVAVVGGSTSEIELTWIREAGLNFTVETFGIDDAHFFLDLNSENIIEEKYDLVICCQVLEHVWNHKNAFRNLSELVKPGGYLWINCPASNLKHGSPHFYAAGLQSELIERNLNLFNFRTLLADEIGTERLYKMTHTFQFWPDTIELKFPILRGYRTRKLLLPLKMLRYLHLTALAIFWSNSVALRSEWSTESFYMGKKVV